MTRVMIRFVVLATALAVGTVVGVPVVAQADPNGHEVWYDADARTYGHEICRIIADNPVPSVLDKIHLALVNQAHVGLGNTGGVIGLSVKRYCPAYLPLVRRYYNIDPPQPRDPCEDVLAEPGMAGNVSCPGQ